MKSLLKWYLFFHTFLIGILKIVSKGKMQDDATVLDILLTHQMSAQRNTFCCIVPLMAFDDLADASWRPGVTLKHLVTVISQQALAASHKFGTLMVFTSQITSLLVVAPLVGHVGMCISCL